MSMRRRREVFVSDAGDLRQMVNDLLGPQKGDVKRRQADCDDNQQHIQIASDAVDTAERILEGGRGCAETSFSLCPDRPHHILADHIIAHAAVHSRCAPKSARQTFLAAGFRNEGQVVQARPDNRRRGIPPREPRDGRSGRQLGYGALLASKTSPSQ
jgi:hypothetical protein